MSSNHPGRPLRLTRDTLLDGSWHAALRATIGPEADWMSDAERQSGVRGMLAQAPQTGEVWVFAFGSLIWNPAFHFAEQRIARIHGHHRRFSLWAKVGRGSPERPGLMLSLERGGSCTGVAYRLAPGTEFAELDVIWRREMLARAYRPIWTRAQTATGPVWTIAFAANRHHDRHAPGLSQEAIVHHLATGEGAMGRASDYLFDTVEHLRSLGIRDRALERIEHAVRARLTDR